MNNQWKHHGVITDALQQAVSQAFSNELVTPVALPKILLDTVDGNSLSPGVPAKLGLKAGQYDLGYIFNGAGGPPA